MFINPAFNSGFAFVASILLLLAIAGCLSTETKSVSQDVDTGIVHFNKLLLQNPENASYRHERAKYFLGKNRLDSSLADLSIALKQDSAQPEYFVTLAEVYFKLNKIRFAISALEKCLSLSPTHIEANLKLAELNLYVRNYQESMDEANTVLGSDPHHAKAYFIKGMIYRETGDTTKAISSFRTVTEQDEEYYAAYMQLGILLASKKDSLALSYYSHALRINPKSEEALYGMGKFFQDAHQWNRALETYSLLLKNNFKFKYAHFNLGVIHLVNLKVPDEGIKHFSHAIQADSNYTEAWYGRGSCFQTIGDVNKALADYKMALKLSPEYSPAQEGFKEVMNLKKY